MSQIGDGPQTQWGLVLVVVFMNQSVPVPNKPYGFCTMFTYLLISQSLSIVIATCQIKNIFMYIVYTWSQAVLRAFIIIHVLLLLLFYVYSHSNINRLSVYML